MKNLKPVKSFERRKEPRKLYGRHIFFAGKGRFYEAELKDFSQKGLFIKTFEQFSVGDIITVALPYSKYKNDKRKARIVRCDHEGFGVKLITKLNGNSVRLYVKKDADWKSFP